MANKASPCAAPGSLPRVLPEGGSSSPETKVKKTTSVHFEEQEVTSPTALEGRCATDYDFDENLKQADALLKAQEKERARNLYHEIYNTSVTRTLLGKDMLLPVISMIGIASTYNNESEDKVKWASLALEKADQIYDQRDSWVGLSKKEKLDTYQALNIAYLKLFGLMQSLPKASGQKLQNIAMKLTAIRTVTQTIQGLSVPHVNPQDEPLTGRPRRDKGPSRLGIIFAVAIGSLVIIIAGVVVYKRVFIKK